MKQVNNKKLFVLDTNILMHDPASLFRFQEHNIFIPMIVLEELDHEKKGLSEISRNVRQTSRFLDALISGISQQEILNGIPLSNNSLQIETKCSGRLFFQTRRMSSLLPKNMPGQLADNSILNIVLVLAKEMIETKVILVSKDINMRIKATALQLYAEDYHNDKVLDDINLLYSGSTLLPENFWDVHGNHMESWKKNDKTYYKLEGPLVVGWYPNQFLYMEGDSNFEAIVRNCEGETAILELAQDYRHTLNNIWGVTARNREQNFALNILTDPKIDLVTLLGTAGTGKTLLALASGLNLTLEQKKYIEIIMTRETVSLGEDIGFLPGTEEEKMAPWMGALMDNMELLNSRANSSEWEQGTTNNLIINRIKIRSLNFMRGRTFLKRYLMIDEAQNLTVKQMKTLITRAGPGTKIICIGNLSQIDTPYLTSTNSGLTYIVDHFKSWQHAAHITLRQGERSRLADYAAKIL